MSIWTSEINLKRYNTFGVEAKAASIARLHTTGDVLTLLEHIWLTGRQCVFLGGGSNVLFVRDWAGIVALNRISGIEIIEESEDFVWVKTGSGHNWHDLVMWSVERGLGGLENLALIPGSVGAGPMQNIGAYGREIKDTFWELEAVDVNTGKVKIFKLEDCAFGYRTSYFKSQGKGLWFIQSVTLRLFKKPVLVLDYGNVREEVARLSAKPTPADVANAVMNIRKSKLPDPAILGNAGSFFKNPELPEKKIYALREKYPEMPVYPSVQPGYLKVAAGWLIEKCGLKGFRRGACGVHAHQALVLVNYGGATGTEILDLAHHILEVVHRTFDIMLEPEVNIIS